jgi:hypothetical protein
MTTQISIARDFSRNPAGRYRKDGKYSGEVFREDVLVPNLMKGPLQVILDGTDGYGSSFLEEAFGGLVRMGKWSFSDLKSRLSVEAETEPYQRYRVRVLKYMEDASRA